MRWSSVVVRVLSGAAVSALIACERTPTAADRGDPGALAFGRTNNNGARIWLPNFDHCAVVDGTGALVPAECRMQVATPSATGNATVVVQVSGVANPTGTTVHWGPADPGWQWAGLFYLTFGLTAPPYPCGVIVESGEVRFTLDWSGTVTPSGQATVTCHYSDRDAYQFPLP